MPIDAAALGPLLEDPRDHADLHRRTVLAGLGGGALAGVLDALWTAPARAETALDVQILQTASSLEALAVAAYDRVLGEGEALAAMAPPSARDTLTAFARETRRQHAEHKRAFQSQTSALAAGARVQDSPNPKFLPVLARADLSTPRKVLDFAALLEKVATDTYLLHLSMLQDPRTKAVMGGVLGVEAQHLAVLRTFAALLDAGTPELVAIPFPAADLMEVPPATGKAGSPDALHQVGGPDQVAEPASGALG